MSGWDVRPPMTVPVMPPTGLLECQVLDCQYTSVAFGQRCREMGSVGDAYDNAPCESFFEERATGVEPATSS